MNEGRRHTYIKILECSVCLETFKDPRMLPCQHTLCLDCLSSLVDRASLVCPLCRTSHMLPDGGVANLPLNLMAVDILDTLCPECRSQEPEVHCFHCEQTICRKCLHGHKVFSDVHASFKRLQDAIDKTAADLVKSAPSQQGVVVEQLITATMDLIINTLKDRKQQLINQVRDRIKQDECVHLIWQEQVKRHIHKATIFHKSVSAHLGENYNDNLQIEEMHKFQRISEGVRKELEDIAMIKPPLPKLIFKCKSESLITAISEFGSIDILPPEAEGYLGSASTNTYKSSHK